MIDTPPAKFTELSSKVRDAVNRILSTEMENAIKIIESGRQAIDALVEQIVLKNYLTDVEIDKILSENYMREDL